MRSSRGFSWVNIWLIVFGAGGLYFGIQNYPLTASFPNQFNSLVGLALLAMTLLAGLRPLLILFRDLTRGKMSVLEDIEGAGWVGALYQRSWKRLWEEKWLVRIFGVIALVNIVAGLVELIIQMHWIHSMGNPDFFRANPGQNWNQLGTIMADIPRQLAYSTSRALSHLIPRLGLGGSFMEMVAYAAIILELVFIGFSRLRKMSQDTEMESEASFASKLLIPVGIASVVLIFIAVWNYAQSHADFMSRFAVPAGRLITSGNPVVRSIPAGGNIIHRFPYAETIPHTVLYALLAGVVLKALASGGIIGALKARMNGGAVSVDAFVRDAVKYFKPLAGFFLLIALLGWVDIPIRMIFPKSITVLYSILWFTETLLIFAPFVIVDKGMSAIQGLVTGFRELIANAADVIMFSAFGISILVLVTIIQHLPTFLIPRFSPFVAVTVVWQWLTGGLISAFMFVAVWEFYRMISAPREAVEVRVSE